MARTKTQVYIPRLILDNENLRISFWDLHVFDLETTKNDSMINLMGRLRKKIDEIYDRNIGKFNPFYEMVDESKDMADDYYHLVQVPMFLKLIQSRLDNLYYINIASILFDLDLIERNSAIYNLSTAQITKNSLLLVNEIKSAMNNIVKSLKIKEISETKSLYAIDTSANKLLKKSSILRGIDLPDDSNHLNYDNPLNGRRLRTRNDNNLDRNNLDESCNDSIAKLNSRNKTNRNGHIRRKLNNSNGLQIKKRNDDIEIGFKYDASIISGESSEEEILSRERDISEENSSQIKGTTGAMKKILKNNNNIGNSNEKQIYNLRRKRHRNFEENFE